MTEYATTPSAIEEWKNQRARTSDWVQHFSAPGVPQTPTSSDSDQRSLWDGGGWEPPSDCESSTSLPPTMMLQYPDSRQVLISPTAAVGGEGHEAGRGGRGDSARTHSATKRSGHLHGNGSGHRTNHAYIESGERRDEERTERARSVRSAEAAPAPMPPRTRSRATANTNNPVPPPIAKSGPGPGHIATNATVNVNTGAAAGTGAAVPSQTSSMRFARAVAAPLPDSHSSSSGKGASGPGSSVSARHPASNRSSDVVAVSDAVAEASHRATSTHSHHTHIASIPRSMNPASHVPSNVPTNHPPPSNHPSQAPSRPPSHHPSRVPSQLPASRTASQPSPPAPSNYPTEHPQPPPHAPSHQPTLNPGPSNNPSHQVSHAPTHQPSEGHIRSHQPSQPASHHSRSQFEPNHPPSAFSNHTITTGFQPAPPLSANGSNGVPNPPSIHSIHPRSISTTDSRSSGPPEDIVVHPPNNTSVSTANLHHPANVPLPPSLADSASLSYFSIPPRQNHSYEPQHQVEREHREFQEAQQEQRRPSITPSHRTSHSQQQNGHMFNAQLPTPISPSPNASLPMRAPSTSTMSGTGLGGGFVLVDFPSAGHEKDVKRELAEGKGSGGKSERQRSGRGSLFGIFGKGGHTRSKSLPMSGMDVQEGAGDQEHHQGKEIPVSPSRSRPQQNQNPNPNPYLTPISPLSPTSPGDPLAGPHPPPIVYAPARHQRATHYSPPRIMYSPRGTRHRSQEAPYGAHQLLHGQTQGYGQILRPSPYPQPYQHQQQLYASASPVVYVQQANPALVNGYGYGVTYPSGVDPGTVHHSKVPQETAPARDSGWDEGKRDTMRSNRHHSANVGDIIVHDTIGQEPGSSHSRSPRTHSPQAPMSPAQVSSPPSHGRSDTVRTPISPTMSQALAGNGSVTSDGTSTRTNLAGVGTVSARSRSRGRSVQANDLGHISEGEGEEDEYNREREHGGDGRRSRSRSRARGMVYSSSAPQPQSQAPPHAAMMIPPPSTVREKGVRETPYPTPPGSTSDQLFHQQRKSQLMHDGHIDTAGTGVASNPSGTTSKMYSNGASQPHIYVQTALTPVSPTASGFPMVATANRPKEASPSPGGLISRFHNIYQAPSPYSPLGVVPPHLSPARDRGSPTSSPSRSRGRARERYPKDGERRHLNGHGGRIRSSSVDSDASHSSVSTYYVIPTPGQKVRIIRTDGMPTTTETTTLSRNNSGMGAGAGGGWFKKAAALRPRFLRDKDHAQDQARPHSPSHLTAPALGHSRTPSGGADSSKSGKSGKSGKKGSGSRKLVRRNSTGSSALLNDALGADASTGAGARNDSIVRERDRDERDVPVDIVIPGQ